MQGYCATFRDAGKCGNEVAGLADKIDKAKKARTRTLQGHGCRLCADGVKALTRIVQTSWDSVRVLTVINLQRLAHKIDRAGNARTRIVQS